MNTLLDTADRQARFLAYELGILTLKGALSTRSDDWPIYAAGVNDYQRGKVQAVLRGLLNQVEDHYAKSHSHQEHCAFIATAASNVSTEVGSKLYKGRLRFGVAQKLVNLHLKYLWVAQVVPEPPHCPIDGRIRDAAGLTYNWTSSDDQAEYESAISTLRKVAGQESLAVFELRTFRRPRQNAV